MDLIKEFSHALQEGLGRSDAALYELSSFNERENAAIAYSPKKKQILLLLLAGRDFPGMNGDEYLDTAKVINKKLGCFSAPDQQIGPHTLWGGKTQGPVYIYKFKVFNEPQN